MYPVRLLVCLFVRFCFRILNPVRYTSGLARTGFKFVPYGTIFHFHRQGEGVASHLSPPHPLRPRPVLARATIVSPFPTFPPTLCQLCFAIPYGLPACHPVRASSEKSRPRLLPYGILFPFLPLSNTVRYFQPNRSGLLLAIPYGLPTGIARLVPYGILF